MSYKFLWILPKWPLPSCDGSRRAAFQLISSLTENGHTIDLCAICSENESVDKEEAVALLGVRNVYVIRKPERLVSQAYEWLTSFFLSPGTPVTLKPYCSKKIKSALISVLEGHPNSRVETLLQRRLNVNDWSCLVYEGIHAAGPAFTGHSYSYSGDRPVVYRAQNREADLWEKKADLTSFYPAKLFLKYQAWRMAAYEDSLLEKAALAAISQEDKLSFTKSNSRITADVVPIGYDFKEIGPASQSDMIQIMYLGKLDWYPNKDGLLWFLEKVWPKVCKVRTNILLRIAGSGNSDWLKPYLKLPNLEFLGKVESVTELYEKSALALVPVFYGSGTRVKAIEAGCYSRACISTALGVQGLNLKPGLEYLQAETEQEWIKQLVNLKFEHLQKIGLHAREKMRQNFDAKASAKKFIDLVTRAEAASFQSMPQGGKGDRLYDSEIKGAEI